jgi:hypothetical protein
MHYHGSTPFGNTSVFIGGHPTNNGDDHQPDMGTFFQTVFAQLTGGLSGGGGGQYPL